MPAPLIILLILAVIVLGIFAWRHEQKRLAALRAWAAKRNWTIDPCGHTHWHEDYTGLKLFDKGHSRRGKNIISGDYHGCSVTLLDYQYTTGSGKNRSTHNRGVVLLKTDFPTIPLLIRREHAFDKVGEFLGMDDIDFESAEFSNTFYVKSPDKKWAYDVIHARVMEFLLKAPKRYTIEYGYGEIAVYKSGHFGADSYPLALRFLHRLYELTPDYLIREMRGE